MSLPKCLLALNFNRLVRFRVRSSDLQQMSSQLYRHRRQPATPIKTKARFRDLRKSHHRGRRRFL